jgi:cytochrome c oxidase subunit 3
LLILFKHNFHILTLSVYPYIFFFISLFLTSSIIIFFKFDFNYFSVFLFRGLFLIFLWFKDIISEGLCGYHNFYVQDGLKFSMILFIFREFIFFFCVFWLFFDSSITPTSDVGEVWSPTGLFLINPLGVPFLNTCILLRRGFRVTWCHYSLLSNKERTFSLILTVSLAFYFLIIQWIEYSEASFCMGESVFGSIFFFSTGFHGAHVIFGMRFLLYNLRRLRFMQFNINHHLGLEFSILYWHFVDVIWLFLFIFIYWWSF